jgi:hypothetical protein
MKVKADKPSALVITDGKREGGVRDVEGSC